jgi:hypothetical protein
MSPLHEQADSPGCRFGCDTIPTWSRRIRPNTLPPALPSATMRQWRYHNLQWGDDGVEPNVGCYTKRRGSPHRRQPRSKIPAEESASSLLVGLEPWSSCPEPHRAHTEPDLGPGFGMLLTQHMGRCRQLPTLDDSSDDRVGHGTKCDEYTPHHPTRWRNFPTPSGCGETPACGDASWMHPRHAACWGTGGKSHPSSPPPGRLPLVKEGRALFGGRGVRSSFAMRRTAGGAWKPRLVGLVRSRSISPRTQQPAMINQSGLPSRLTVDHAARCGSERPLPSLRPRPAICHMPYTPME